MDYQHRFIPSPTGVNTRTLVLFHGTGGDEEDLIPLGRMLAPNAALLGIRGKVDEGGAARFFRRLAEGVFDEEDLVFRTHEIARFLQQATTAYSLRREGLVAVGYSNGSNIIASLLLLEPAVFSAAVLFRAMVPLQVNELPDLRGKHILMLSGRHDPLIPADNSGELADMFERSGAIVTHQVQNSGHGLTNPEFAMAEAWLQKHL